MHTYKTFLKIALKNSPTALIYVVIFMVIAVIATNDANESDKEMYKDSEISFTVFNRDNSEIGDKIKDFLSDSNNYVDIKDNEEAIKKAIYYRKIYYAVVVPEGFEELLKDSEDAKLGSYKVKDSAMAYYMDMTVENYMKTLKSYMAMGYDMDLAATKTKEVLSESIRVTLTNEIKHSSDVVGNTFTQDIDNLGNKPAYSFFYQYIPYMFLAIITAGIGKILITFGKKDIRNRINVSAQSFTSNSIQMILGVTTFAGVVLLVFNLLGLTLYSESISLTEVILFVANTICMLLLSVSVALFAGFAFSKTAIMDAFSNVVSLGLSFLGGIFVPMELFDESLINIARFTPTYWYMKANNAIIGVDRFSKMNNTEILGGYGVQLLFALAFFSASLVILRKKREEA